MKKIPFDEVKSIQLDLLKDVADFCEKNGLTYFLAYGTLIGAIRHNGYIPWDDDLDIAMPRPDYDKFIKTYNRNDSYKKVIDIAIDKTYGVQFAKVYDDRTWLNEYKYRKENYGVYIDVFPIDGVKGTFRIRLAQKLDKILHAKKANYAERSLLKNISNCLVKILCLPFPVYSILRFADKNARRYSYGVTEKAANFLETYGVNEIVDTSVFQRTLLHTFEGGQYRIPEGYDLWLRTIYGDYMQLPPVNQQIPHHVSNAYWKDKNE
jgi:lipopolysaccharide cholinephosphotransferase